MAIAKKPVSIKHGIDLTETIINKGGSSSSNEEHENQSIKVTIRLTSKMLYLIDNYLEKSINKKTRTCWVREAVEEKIKRDII